MKWINLLSSFVLLLAGTVLHASESAGTFSAGFIPRTGGVPLTPAGTRIISSRRTSMAGSYVKLINDLNVSEKKRVDDLFAGSASVIQDVFGFEDDTLVVKACAYGIQQYHDEAHAKHLIELVEILSSAVKALPQNTEIENKLGLLTTWYDHLLVISSDDEIMKSFSEEVFDRLKMLFQQFDTFIEVHAPKEQERLQRAASFGGATRRDMQNAQRSFSMAGLPQGIVPHVDPAVKKATQEKAQALFSATNANDQGSIRPDERTKASIRDRAAKLNLRKNSSVASASTTDLPDQSENSDSVARPRSDVTPNTVVQTGTLASPCTPRYMHGGDSPDKPAILPPPFAVDPNMYKNSGMIQLPPPPPVVADPAAFMLPASDERPSSAPPLTTAEAPVVPDTTYRAPVPPIIKGPITPAPVPAPAIKADKKEAGVNLTKIIIGSGALGIGAWLFKVYFWDNPKFAQKDGKNSVKV